MDKNIKTGAAIAKNQFAKKDFGDTIHNTTATTTKAKMTTLKTNLKGKLEKIRPAVLEWLDSLPNRLSRGILRGLVIAIVLNVITRYFWSELPETIPTIYEFFNGFLVVSEFLYKTALGGIASIFNGTFFEFSNTVMVEIGEMWSTFCTWISAISF